MTRETRNYQIANYAITTPDAATREDGAAAPRLEGYAAVFNSDSVMIYERGREFIERLTPGVFARSVANASTKPIQALWSHDTGQPLGSTRNDNLILREDDHGLWFSLSLERMTPAQLAAARDGDLQVSFGMENIVGDWTRRDDGTALFTVTDLDLFEISPVVFPAYPSTVATVRSMEVWEASEQPEQEEVAEEVVRADYSIQAAKIRLKKAKLKAKLG